MERTNVASIHILHLQTNCAAVEEGLRVKEWFGFGGGRASGFLWMVAILTEGLWLQKKRRKGEPICQARYQGAQCQYVATVASFRASRVRLLSFQSTAREDTALKGAG
jgi:hypothetical protein